MSEEQIPFAYTQSVVQNQSLLDTSISKLYSQEEKMRLLGETIRRQQENSMLLSPHASLFHRKPVASMPTAGVTKPYKMMSSASRSSAAIRGTSRPSTLAVKAATGIGKYQQTKTQIDKENTYTYYANIRPKWSSSTRVAVEHTRPRAFVTRPDLSKENTLANTRPIKPYIESKVADASSKGSNGLASSAPAKPVLAEPAPLTKTAKSSSSKPKSSSSKLGCGGIPFIPRKATTVGKAPVLGDKSRIKRV